MSFTAHAVEHLVVGMVVPLLVVLANPFRNVTRGRASRARTARAVMRLPVITVWLEPVVTTPVFVAVPFAAYLSPLYAWSLTSAVVHHVTHTVMATAAALFFTAVLRPRSPRRHPPGIRALMLAFRRGRDSRIAIATGTR